MIPKNGLPINGSMSNGYLPYGYPPNVYPPSMYPPNNYPQSMYPQNNYPQNGYAQSPYQSTSYKPMSSYTSMVERSTTRFSEKEKEEFLSKLNGTTMSKLMIEEEPLSKIVPREKEEKEMKEKKEKVVKKKEKEEKKEKKEKVVKKKENKENEEKKENKVKNENKEKKAKKEKKVAVKKTRATLHDNDYMKSFEATSLPVNFKASYTKTAMLKSAHISFSMPRMKLEPVLEDKKLEHEDWRVQVLEVIVNEETMKYFIPYTLTEFNELYDCYVYQKVINDEGKLISVYQRDVYATERVLTKKRNMSLQFNLFSLIYFCSRRPDFVTFFFVMKLDRFSDVKVASIIQYVSDFIQ